MAEPLKIDLTKMALPHATLADAKPLVGFDYKDAMYHVLLFDFGDDGGAIGVLREGDTFCARIPLDTLAEFCDRAREENRDPADPCRGDAGGSA